jgi:hypothetical protein
MHVEVIREQRHRLGDDPPGGALSEARGGGDRDGRLRPVGGDRPEVDERGDPVGGWTRTSSCRRVWGSSTRLVSGR